MPSGVSPNHTSAEPSPQHLEPAVHLPENTTLTAKATALASLAALPGTVPRRCCDRNPRAGSARRLLRSVLVSQVLMGVGSLCQAGVRLPFTLRETAGVARLDVPVVITGETVFARTVERDVRTVCIRLADANGRELPCQVDEKDGTGLYQHPGNGLLDADDEIVFQVDLAAHGKQTYSLHLDRSSPVQPGPPGGVVVEQTVLTSRQPYNVCLSNPHLSVGIRGGAEEQVYPGRGKGAILSFHPAGKSELVSVGAWCFYSHTQTGVSWSQPALVAAGPVRSIVQVRADTVDGTFERLSGEWTVFIDAKARLQGSMRRYYTLYSQLPYLECAEVYVVRAASADFTVAFGFPFRTAAVSPLERGDILYGPWEDGIHEVSIEQKRFFDTAYPFEGWLGVSSERNATGLALFFDHGKAVRAFGSLVRSYYRDHVGKKDAWLTSDLVVAYRLQDMKPGDVVTNRFGLCALNGQKAEAIRNLYLSLWGAPLECTWAPGKEAE